MTDSSAAAELVLAAASEGDARRLPERLCEAMCVALPVDGATISLLTDTPDRQLLHACGESAMRLEEVQFEVDEGPCVTAAATGQAVIVADLHGRLTQWPIFGAAARHALGKIGSVYAFPMSDGSEEHPVGSVDLLRHEPWDPDEETVRECARATRAATVALLTAPTALPWNPTPMMDAHWGRTHRAAGMLSQETGVPVAEALARLRADAFVTGKPLPEIAEETLDRLHGGTHGGGAFDEGRGPYGS
ncbi:GAF and ANTAR domain-containing protein [Streptomyces sp. NPDC000151]|uniref:GAF and ANTAR domain-containing protein n=1 Tax=Streptomyces sp. NPDC000151 TaxID=3154244 RepID=UPI00331718F0